jgi:predicted transcriptional regulator
MLATVNKPTPNLQPSDNDLGPLDEHGQQIWSPETEAAIARLEADPTYQADVAAGLASVARGDGFDTKQVLTELTRRRAAR